MNMRILRPDVRVHLLFVLFFPLLLAACEHMDDYVSGPQLPTDRSLFFTSAFPDSGLYRWGIRSGQVELVSEGAVLRSSRIARNGTLVFSRRESHRHSLQAYCPNGALIPVPMPVSENPWITYALTQADQFDMSYEGHRLAYTVWEFDEEAQDSSEYWLSLAVVECGTLGMTLSNLRREVDTYLYDLGLSTNFVDCNSSPVISADGRTVWLPVVAYRHDGEAASFVRELMLEWHNGAVRVLAESEQPVRWKLRGYSRSHDAVLVTRGNGSELTFMQPGSGSMIPVPMPAVAAQRIAEHRPEVAGSVGDGDLALYSMPGWGVRGTVLTHAQLRQLQPSLQSPRMLAPQAIAPDADWVGTLVAEDTGEDAYSFRILAVYRQGTEVVPGPYIVSGRIVAISNLHP